MRSMPLWSLVPATFGDADAEYGALVHGCGLLDRCGGVVRVTGPDARAFLHGQLSADVNTLAVGETAPALLLTPKGRLVAAGAVHVHDETELWLVAERTVLDSAVEALRQFLVRTDAQVGRDPAARVWGLAGPLADTASLPGEAIVLSGTDALTESLVVAHTDDLVVPDATPVGRDAADARRVELTVPFFGVDFDTSTIPHDAGLVPSHVSVSKGCYTGQELIERIYSRGHANRAPRTVRFEPDAPVPEPGADVTGAGGKAVGSLTTVAWCRGWTPPAPGGLGLLRREIDSGDTVQVEDKTGVVL